PFAICVPNVWLGLSPNLAEGLQSEARSLAVETLLTLPFLALSGLAHGDRHGLLLWFAGGNLGLDIARDCLLARALLEWHDQTLIKRPPILIRSRSCSTVLWSMGIASK